MIKLRRYILLLSCCLLASPFVNAQKAKFKNSVATVQKTRLPRHYVDPANRTYNLFKKGTYSTNVETHEKRIFGWTLDQENPNLKGVISIYGFSIGKARRNSQKKEKKDKDGNVTESWTEYTYTASAEGRATLYIYGEDNRFEYERKKRKKSKAELNREAAEAAQKEDLADNPFLSSEDISEAEESDIGENAGLDGEALQLVSTIDLDITEEVTTGAHRSATAAYNEYREKRRPQLFDFRAKYPDMAYSNAMRQLNYLYGYTPVNSRIYLRAMKSDKHIEYKKWNDAVQATQTLFKAFRYNESIADKQAKFDPIIDYYARLVDRFADSDRKAKKIKYAAFQNLMNILFYLDRHDELISLCEGQLDSKVLDKQAKRMLEKSEKLRAHLAFHRVETCHFESMEEIAEDEMETEEVVEEEAVVEGAE